MVPVSQMPQKALLREVLSTIRTDTELSSDVLEMADNEFYSGRRRIRSLPELIRDGYLVALRGYRVATHADLQHIGGSGDFSVEELDEAVNIEDRNALVARAIQELARDRRTIVFCVTVSHARNLARALAPG